MTENVKDVEVQVTPNIEMANRLDSLRQEMELRFTGEFVENAVNRLDSAANFLRRLAHAPAVEGEIADPVAHIWATNPSYKAMDPEALERWRAHAREGNGHDIAEVNKNTLYRLIGTIDALAALHTKTPDTLRERALEAKA